MHNMYLLIQPHVRDLLGIEYAIQGVILYETTLENNTNYQILIEYAELRT